MYGFPETKRVVTPISHPRANRYAPPSQPVPPRVRRIDPTEHTVSTEADGWTPSPSLPTGFRIV